MASKSIQQRALRTFGRAILRTDEPMSAHTSFRIGGPARLFAEPHSQQTLADLLAFCREEGVPWFVLGFGTNLLVSDRGYDGMVVRLREGWDSLRVSGRTVEAGPGHSLPKLARKTAGMGLSGLEFAAGIPGSIGGAIAMNAGAFGGSVAQVVERVECLTPAGEQIHLTVAELAFAYRRSRVLDEHLVVIKSVLALDAADSDEIAQRMEQFQTQRRERQPLAARSAGSIFRNPPGDAAGRLLEAAGCKRLRVGGALVSPKHANFIVNAGGAAASDVASLMTEAQRRVWEQFGIRLEPEITLLGRFDLPMPRGPPA